jgi:hypothetical protein
MTKFLILVPEVFLTPFFFFCLSSVAEAARKKKTANTTNPCSDLRNNEDAERAWARNEDGNRTPR